MADAGPRKPAEFIRGKEGDGPAAASPSSSKKAKKKKKAAAAAAAAAAAPKSAPQTPAQIFTQIIVDDAVERSQWDGASVAKSAEAQWGDDEYWRRMRARVTKVIHDHDLMSTASGLEIIDDALLEAIDSASSMVFVKLVSELGDAEKAGRLSGGHNGKFEGKDKGKGKVGYLVDRVTAPMPSTFGSSRPISTPVHLRFPLLETLYAEEVYPTLSCLKAIAEHAHERPQFLIEMFGGMEKGWYTLNRPKKSEGWTSEATYEVVDDDDDDDGGGDWMNVQCELCKTQVDLGNITHQLGCCYDDLINHEEEPEDNQIEQAKSCDKKYCAVFLQLLNTALAIWATDSEHIKTGYIVVIGLVGALNKLLGVNNWAAFPPEKECTCCTTQMELIKCGSHYRTGALRELEGDVVAKLIEADCVDGLFQFLRTRGFAMGSEGSGAKRIQFSTDWRDPTPTDNEKKVYRQMQ